MNFRQLERFVVLADTLNFRRAAEKLFISQPPLSISIQKLEAELGVQLFERGKDGVGLTKSGEAALVHARQVLDSAARFANAARLARSGEAGLLRLGFVGSATYELLPNLVTAFRSRFPLVEIELREATSTSIIQKLDEDQLDAGLVRVPVAANTGTRLLPLQEESFVVALPPDHHLVRTSRITMGDLAMEPFIMYPPMAAGLRMAAMHACQACGFSPRVAQEAAQVQTVLSLVEAGLGVALVPSTASRQRPTKACLKTITDLPETATIGLSLVWQPSVDSPAVRNLRLVATELKGANHSE